MPRRVVRVAPGTGAVDGRTLQRGVAAIQSELDVTAEFPAEVLTEAEEAARSPRLPDLDRTDLPFVTIDPPGAMDLDQALHIQRNGSGFRVYYAIADVAAFVRPGGAVDEEANRRGETLYGVDQKVPLHPPVISEDACSLLPGGDRPALLWTLDVDDAGEGSEVTVERAMVRSRAKLTYEEVQREVDAGTADEVFGLLREVGELRLARERARGGVSLPLPDQEVSCEDGHWRLGFREARPVEDWNAHISLLTGMAAAHLMTGHGTGVLRTLAPADPRDVARLKRVARGLHVAWPDRVDYPEFIRSLDPTRAADAAMLNASTVLLRGSGYLPFRGVVPERAEHSALASEYAHVTAPLRRLVDRYAGEICLAHSSGYEVPDWVLERMDDLPATMRDSSRRANAYERSILDLVEAAVLRDSVGRAFQGMVVQVDQKSPQRGEIVLAEPAVEAPLVSADGEPLPLGSDVTATLVEADPGTRSVRFQLG